MKHPVLQRPDVRAFSLMELLVVIAILMVLMALAVGATGSLMRSMSMSRAASLITDEVNFARQTALAQNRDVEVRFYRLGSKMDANDKAFRAVRSFLSDISDPAKAQPLSKVKSLPDNVIISENSLFSTLLDHATRSCLVRGTEDLPSGSTDYVSFRFRANGATSLKPVTGTNSTWYLTLHGENLPTNASTGLPDNYFTAQIDPVTGRVRSYRP